MQRDNHTRRDATIIEPRGGSRADVRVAEGRDLPDPDDKQGPKHHVLQREARESGWLRGRAMQTVELLQSLGPLQPVDDAACRAAHHEE